MKIIQDKITLKELKVMAKETFGNLVKAVVDVEKEIMAIDAPMHADKKLNCFEKVRSRGIFGA